MAEHEANAAAPILTKAKSKRRRIAVYTLAEFAERVKDGFQHIEYCGGAGASPEEFNLVRNVLASPNEVDAIVVSNYIGPPSILADLIECLSKPSMHELSLLSLYNCAVPESVFNAIIDLLLNYSSLLYKVRLRRCSLPPRFTCRVFRTMLKVEKIQLLEISENAIDSAGIEALRDLITANTPLQTLLIGFMEIGNEGVREIAEALKQSTTLRSLSLSYNSVLNTGCERIAEALHINTTLETIYLKVAGISDTGAACLFRALETNTSLQHLDLSMNVAVSSSTWVECGKLLNVNETISSVETKGYHGKTVDAIRARLARRSEQRKQTFLQAAQSLSERQGSWGRGKLMLLGSARAGKTATVRSLLNKRFKPDTRSALGLMITQADVRIGTDDPWKLGPKGTYASLYVHRNVAKVLRSQQRTVLDLDGKKKKAKRVSKMKFPLMPKLRLVLPAMAEGKVEEGKQEADAQPVEEVFASLYKESQFIKHFPTDILRISVWDYSSEGLLKTLHQLFITRHGVYMIVFSLKVLTASSSEASTKALDTVVFWLNAIKLHAPEAPFLLVGTFYDALDHPEERLQTVEAALYDVIRGEFDKLIPDGSRKFWPIDNKSGFGLSRVKAAIEDAVRGEDYVNMNIPLRWVQALDTLLKTGETWLTLDRVITICSRFRIGEQEAMQLLSLAHELGTLLYFTGTEKLKQVVTLHPKWLVVEMSKVIGYYTIHRYDVAAFEQVGLKTELLDLLQRSIVSRDLLNHLWSPKHTEFLLDLTRSLLLMSSWRFENRNETYLVPNLIDEKQTVTFSLGTETASLRFSFGYLPFGVFERLVCVMVDYSSKQDNVPAPQLSKTVCVTWLKEDYPVQINKQPESQSIEYTIQSSKNGVHCLEFVSLATRKIKADLKWDSFTWKILVQKDDHFIPIQEAKQIELAPWFLQTKHANDTNVNAFLSSF